jgi:hypothetical protein
LCSHSSAVHLLLTIVLIKVYVHIDHTWNTLGSLGLVSLILLELMVVLIVITAIVGILGNNINNAASRSRNSKCMSYYVFFMFVWFLVMLAVALASVIITPIYFNPDDDSRCTRTGAFQKLQSYAEDAQKSICYTCNCFFPNSNNFKEYSATGILKKNAELA